MLCALQDFSHLPVHNQISALSCDGCVVTTGLCDAGLVLAAALVALSCGDMHYTARFFHERTETTLGALLGLLAFQIPVAWWLLYGFTVPMSRV